MFESSGNKITWEVFLTTFFDKYFLDSAKNEKETEFIQRRQGSMTIGQYVAKFEEIPKSSSYVKSNLDGCWKATKFEWGLRPKIREKISTLEIKNYATLVNK